jgi:hypothetical protein
VKESDDSVSETEDNGRKNEEGREKEHEDEGLPSVTTPQGFGGDVISSSVKDTQKVLQDGDENLSHQTPVTDGD